MVSANGVRPTEQLTASAANGHSAATCVDNFMAWLLAQAVAHFDGTCKTDVSQRCILCRTNEQQPAVAAGQANQHGAQTRQEPGNPLVDTNTVSPVEQTSARAAAFRTAVECAHHYERLAACTGCGSCWNPLHDKHLTMRHSVQGREFEACKLRPAGLVWRADNI